jgi:hypothetical protein
MSLYKKLLLMTFGTTLVLRCKSLCGVLEGSAYKCVRIELRLVTELWDPILHECYLHYMHFISQFLVDDLMMIS